MEELETAQCYISRSEVDGYGVFARTRIPAGTRISEFTGVEMSYQDFKAKYGNDYTFTYQRRPYWLSWIVAKEKRNLITYVNDGYFGKAPNYHNCILQRKWLVSIREIEPGEELLLQYPKNYFTNKGKSKKVARED